MGETGEDTNRFFIKCFSHYKPPSYQRVLCVFFRLKIYKNFIIIFKNYNFDCCLFDSGGSNVKITRHSILLLPIFQNSSFL